VVWRNGAGRDGAPWDETLAVFCGGYEHCYLLSFWSGKKLEVGFFGADRS
jgi:hypothetical protein